MSRLFFPAVIERAATGYSVFFPDFPGCTSAGRTAAEAARNAEEALNLHLLGMAQDGETIPAPADIGHLSIDPDVTEVARLLVPATLPGRKVRVNVMMDEHLLAAIDKHDSNRSRFLDQAVRKALG